MSLDYGIETYKEREAGGPGRRFYPGKKLWETACNAKRDTGQSIDPTLKFSCPRGIKFQCPKEKTSSRASIDGEEHEKATESIINGSIIRKDSSNEK